jgi:hypothetical protein
LTSGAANGSANTRIPARQAARVLLGHAGDEVGRARERERRREAADDHADLALDPE